MIMIETLYIPCSGLKPPSLPPESDGFKSEATILTRPVQTGEFIKFINFIKLVQVKLSI